MARVLIAHNFKDESFSSMSHRLAHWLSERHEVVFMSYRPFFPERLVLMDGRLIVYSWPTKARPTGIRDMWHFVRIYLRHRPEVVIAHFVGANICNPISKLLSFFRVRTYEWYHTLSTQLEYDGGRIPRWQKLRRWMMFRFFTDTVVPVSDMAARDYSTFYRLNNCRVVLNAIRDEYRGEDADFGSDRIRIGFLGRFVPHKGVDILIGMMDGLPADRFQFRIAGEGPEQAELEKRSVSNVAFAGFLSYDRVREFIEGCHVIVIPSYTDALVVVGIETLMLKRCLVVSNGVGLSEYLHHREDAWICEPSVEAFQDAMLQLDTDRGLAGKIASAGREAFLARFNMDAHVRNVERMILG